MTLQDPLLGFHPILDVVGAQDGQPVVHRRHACRTGVADNFKAAPVGRRALGDLADPGLVGSPFVAIIIELGRARLEQELDGEAIAVPEAEVDHLAEGIHCGSGAMQLVAGQIHAVVDAQLVAARHHQGVFIELERGLVSAGVIGLDAFVDQRRCKHAVGVGRVDRVADLCRLAALHIGLRGRIPGVSGTVLEKGDRCRIDAVRQRARHSL